MGKSFKIRKDDYEDDYFEVENKKKQDIRIKRKQKQEKIQHIGDDDFDPENSNSYR